MSQREIEIDPANAMLNIRAERETLAACFGGHARTVRPLVNSEDYYWPETEAIYNAVCTLIDRNREVTALAVQDMLREANQDHLVEYTTLEKLTADGAKVRDPQGAAERVASLAASRKLYEEFGEMRNGLYRGTLPLEKAVQRTMSDCFSIRLPGTKQSLTSQQAVTKARDHLTRARDGKVIAFTTSYPTIDVALGGIRPGQMVCLLGSPGSGKSLLKLMTLRANAKRGIASLDYILEMETTDEINRLTAIESAMFGPEHVIDHRRIRGGPGIPPLTDEEFRRAVQIQDTFANWPIYYDDTKNDIWAILADAEKRVHDNEVQIVAIDYAQLVQAGDGSQETAEQKRVSRTCLEFAKEHKVVMYLLLSMDKSGMTASESDEHVSGANSYGSSAFYSDASAFMYVRLFPYRFYCSCPDQVIDEKKYGHKKPRRRHLNDDLRVCSICKAEGRDAAICKEENRLGVLDIFKARGGEVNVRAPIKLFGPSVTLVEVTRDPVQQAAMASYTEAETVQ